MRCLVRPSSRSSGLEALDCELAVGDVTDPVSLRAAATGCEAVVHLVAIIAGRPADFERVMTQGTRDLVAAAREAGVRRLVLASALGVGHEGSASLPYYRSKQAMEELVAGSGLGHAILRPSFVFAGDGGVLPRFLRIARLAPVTPIPGPGTQRIQPLAADDLARGVALALDSAEDLVAELGGPDVVDWNELWQRLKRALGVSRPALNLPFALLRPVAALAERLPGAPLTRDQIRMLGLPDNVVGDGGAAMERLGLRDLVPLDEQLRRAVAR